MNINKEIQQVLQTIGRGHHCRAAAYDTAWVARMARTDPGVSEKALDWVRKNQLADGSWGTDGPCYYHDRLLCTLSSMITLAKYGKNSDKKQWKRGRDALDRLYPRLGLDAAGETIGFEMLVPMLLTEASNLGLMSLPNDEYFGKLIKRRAEKLQSLPSKVINRYTTVAFSAEMAGSDGMALIDKDNLLEPNGSVSYSPAATAYYILHFDARNKHAQQYLRQIMCEDGSVTSFAPFDIFERSWVLWNIAITGLQDNTLHKLCTSHVDILQALWKKGKGLGFATGYEGTDADHAGIINSVFSLFGRVPDLDALFYYESDDHFRCFPQESNPSVSANAHILDALRHAGYQTGHPKVHKILSFLRKNRIDKAYWMDKWHVSPFYPTSHAILAAMPYDPESAKAGTDWILSRQNRNGSWGFYSPTAEETAYCVQALVKWKQLGNKVPAHVLRRATAWLKDHAGPPYPALWISKCLYSPQWVVRAAILSALAMVEQD